MGVYELILGVGTILVVAFYWILYVQATDDIGTIISTLAPNATEQITLFANVMYYSFFIFTIIVLIWIYKSSVDEQENVYQ